MNKYYVVFQVPMKRSDESNGTWTEIYKSQEAAVDAISMANGTPTVLAAGGPEEHEWCVWCNVADWVKHPDWKDEYDLWGEPAEFFITEVTVCL